MQEKRAGVAAFLLAAALGLALCWFAHGAVLRLALLAAGPLPAAQTALSRARMGREESETLPESVQAPAESTAPAQQSTAGTDIENELVPLEGDDARPADAGTVQEKTYPQGGGEKYIPCGAGSIKNNTRVSATEDYRLSAGLWYRPGDGARTTDRSRNMCAVGRVMADTLNAAGLNTLHDETLNDYPSYTGSYANSRAVVQQYLAQYPSIKVVLDVHRDAIETDSGTRMAPVCTVDGRQAAQVMIICGCDNGGSVTLPNWRQNLRFAAAWEAALEGRFPGFTRPVLFSYRFYNQDLTTGSLLIEIGGHGNNLNEALYAGKLAAEGLVAALQQ